MAVNSYHPTERMIRRLLIDENGFTEPRPDAHNGGYNFFLSHDDGRIDVAFVFPWSNFRAAEEEDIAPCKLITRITLNAAADIDDAVWWAPNGDSTEIEFGPGQWSKVCELFTLRVMPIFQMPSNEVWRARWTEEARDYRFSVWDGVRP